MFTVTFLCVTCPGKSIYCLSQVFPNCPGRDVYYLSLFSFFSDLPREKCLLSVTGCFRPILPGRGAYLQQLIVSDLRREVFIVLLLVFF